MVIRNKLYNGEVELIFDSYKHKYTYNGEVVPSVTTALSIIAKPALVNWSANCAVDHVKGCINPGVSYNEIELEAIWGAARRAHWEKKTDAGTVGTLVHKWIENYIKGENPGMPVAPELQEAINKFLNWVKEYDVKFILSEQPIYSKKYNYCGTFDFICTIGGKMYIGDTKTSSGIYPEYLVQTAAYRYARTEEFPEEKFTGQLIIRIGKDASFEFVRVSSEKMYEQMFKTFLSAVKLQSGMETLKNYKPERD